MAMVNALLVRLRSMTTRVARNPHFWVVVVLSVGLLLIYQGWPWPEWKLHKGLWRLFPWLTELDFLVVHVEIRYHLFGTLFLLPIIYASLTLSWPGGIFAWLLALIWVLPTLLSWNNSSVIINLALLLLPALLVAFVNGERRWRESERRYFAERERERLAYIAKLVETEETERRRIAQELHDETLQTLMVIANKSASLALSSTDEQQVNGNLWIKQEVLQAMDDLRRLSMNLRPSILDNFGLVSGIRWLVNNSNSQNGYRLDISVTGEERKMTSLSEVTMFRVAQEAINNIQRHAHAKSGTVSLGFEKDRLVLEVKDDGIGMQQRVLSVGGEVRVDASPGEGTRIWVSVPYAGSAQVIEGKNP
jgi:signal transduction histidine kinase